MSGWRAWGSGRWTTTTAEAQDWGGDAQEGCKTPQDKCTASKLIRSTQATPKPGDHRLAPPPSCVLPQASPLAGNKAVSKCVNCLEGPGRGSKSPLVLRGAVDGHRVLSDFRHPLNFIDPWREKDHQTAARPSPWHLNDTVTVLRCGEPAGRFHVHQPASQGGPSPVPTRIGEGDFCASPPEKTEATQTKPTQVLSQTTLRKMHIQLSTGGGGLGKCHWLFWVAPPDTS